MDELRVKLAGLLRGWLDETAAGQAPTLVMTLERDEVVSLLTILEVNTHTQADIDSMWVLLEGCREANRILREKVKQ